LLVDSKYLSTVRYLVVFKEFSGIQVSTDPIETRTQAQRAALSDKAMVDAAIELIIEHGTEKTTLQAIGEKAGYSRGLATYRYGSKAGLFDEVCKSISRRWLDYLKEGVGDNVGIDAMCAALDAFYRFISDSPRDARVLQILYCGAASPRSEFRHTSVNIHQRQQDDVADWLRTGIAQGTVREDVDPTSVAAQYIAYISGMTYLWLINPSSVDFEKANDDMKQHLRIALSP
jgi:AcrR family transcriptional regulator